MLVRFFYQLRGAGLPVSVTEFLTLLEAMKHGLGGGDVNEFYFLARSTLVKSEAHFDRFDQVFGDYYRGVEKVLGPDPTELPDEWLRRQAELFLSPEERQRIEGLGGFEALMEALKQRLEEQKKRHQGGNRMIGTAGTSPFGAYGFNPEGVRIGQDGSRHRRGAKVWDRREYRNLDDDVQLGTRNIKIALRRLRRFARQGAEEELDLDDTIRSTARQGGLLDIRMVPERHNAIKVLLFLDIGGSMDDHIRLCEEMFSAARSEFKHLEYFYFHNCVYESVWRDNRRRHAARTPTMEVLRTYGRDYKLIFVGDATMSPYEIIYPGGSVEHWNEEPGSLWMQRLLGHYGNAVWLNPEPENRWDYTPSTGLLRDLLDQRMFPLTIRGLERGMKELM